MSGRQTIVITLVVAGLSWLLAACGQSPAAAPVPPAPSAAPAATAPAPTEPPAAAPAAGFGDIPQGTTPEGYQYLGDPAAPATLVMYSDFL